MQNNIVLKLEDVFFSYNKQTVLEKINFTIYSGQIITIIGPNGGGKTTLAKLVLNLLKPNKGTVKLEKNISLGYMPQRISLTHLMPLTVARFLGLSINDRCNHYSIEEIANMLKISYLLNKQIYNLSGGELQKIIFACSLINKPDLLVLDEPIQGIDITGQMEFYTMIERIRDIYKIAILMISHDLYMVMKATNHVICLNKHICCEGTPENISKHSSYIDLFGQHAINKIAVYQHYHDHKH
ncbi:Zinc import ATP-binding protein ZnuC [Rickettsiales bacterium Ac37b]|nr:Zinc import ATP-binding protein ZnuC [Rickettsiales bacterium Ac37b]